ncbi:MAG: pilin [Xanthomonadales bacterium]|nr:pilin [Xanthomonadales bacterium]MCB1633271.1 pilin [Xanthomonadales bacterium]MCB1642560.1 pilin [Xanthomonadales bacterium]
MSLMLGRLLRLVLLLLAILLAALIYRVLFPMQPAPVPGVTSSSEVQAPMHFDPNTDPQLRAMRDYADQAAARATFVGEFAQVMALRVAMTECYMNDGHWPDDGCGVLLSDLQGKLLQTASIGEEGLIRLDFRAGMGLPAITVELQPTVNTVGVRWQCSSPNHAEIGRLLTDCEYLP